jgi:hypothetical protein
VTYIIIPACIAVLYKSLQVDVLVYTRMCVCVCVLLCVRKTEFVNIASPSLLHMHAHTHTKIYVTTLKIECCTISAQITRYETCFLVVFSYKKSYPKNQRLYVRM